jgi:hypothetical protein
VAKTAGAPAAAAIVERGPFAGAEAPDKAGQAAGVPAAQPASAAAPPAEAAAPAARRTTVPRARPTPEEIAARRANRPTRPSRTPSAPASGAQPQN